jgi:hypothetical protein
MFLFLFAIRNPDVVPWLPWNAVFHDINTSSPALRQQSIHGIAEGIVSDGRIVW